MIKKAISLITAALVFAMSAQSVFAVSGKGNDYILSTDELTESYVDTSLDASIFEQTKVESDMTSECSTEVLSLKNKYAFKFDIKLLEDAESTETMVMWFGKGGKNDVARDKITIKPNERSIIWNEYDKRGSRSEEMTYDFSDDISVSYNVYAAKDGTDFVFGIKRADEAEYSYLHVTSEQTADGAFSARTRGFMLEISDVVFYMEKPADPMPEIEQNILDTEFDMIDAKDSLFNGGDTYSINNGSTTSYNGLSDNSVIKITMKPGKQTDSWQNMRIYLGDNETITFNQSTDKIAYKNTKTSTEKTIDYDFVNDGTSDSVGGTIYHVYVSKTDGTLVFGIKQADETTYVWFTIENAESDNYTSLKFGTNGYRTNVSNAYVYTKKIPMPEVSEETLGEKYDKTDITASFAVCAQTDFSQAGDDVTSNPTYNGISDGDVLKFNLASKTKQNESWHWFRIFLGKSETLVIDQIAKTITYTNSVNTALKSVLNFNFANDDETVYNVYLEKTDGNLVIGIKESTQDSYTWMKIDNAVNDDYSFLRMRTFGFPVTISDACLYTEKETDTLYDMKLNKNVQSGNAEITLDIMRLSNKAKDNGILVTAVYVTENNVEKLYSIKFSAEKKLYKKEYTNFVNNVSIPTDGQYKIENYLWNTYSDFSPITEILELH